jgi:hypothetical protein
MYYNDYEPAYELLFSKQVCKLERKIATYVGEIEYVDLDESYKADVTRRMYQMEQYLDRLSPI